MNKLIFVSLSFAAAVAASGAQAQASNHDAARSAPPGRGAVDDVNRNNVPDLAEGGGRWWPMSQYEWDRRAQEQHHRHLLEQEAAREREALERRHGRVANRRDRDGDGVRNRDDRHPDDPRYR